MTERGPCAASGRCHTLPLRVDIVPLFPLPEEILPPVSFFELFDQRDAPFVRGLEKLFAQDVSMSFFPSSLFFQPDMTFILKQLAMTSACACVFRQRCLPGDMSQRTIDFTSSPSIALPVFLCTFPSI